MFKVNTTLLNLVRTSGLLLSLAIMFFFYVTTVQAGQVSLAWDASPSPNVGGYRIYYGQASGNYTANADAGNQTTYTLTGLEDGKTYYFAAKAYDIAKTTESGFSNEVNATIGATSTAPTAGFSATPTTGPMPLVVTFSSAASTGNITTWSWDFGDGTTSPAPNPSKTYLNSGVYTVKLKVTGPGGENTATKTNYISVAPAASFTANPTSGPEPLVVTLTDTSTGSISSRSWNFGDGSTTTVSTAQTFVKSYAYKSTPYTVTLTVTGAGGSNTKTQTITANAVQPAANFSATTTSVPLTVKLSNSSTGTVTGWSWNFGDGGTSTAQNPLNYTYKAADTYTISLTATGPTGTTPSTKTQTITVTAASAGSGGLVAAYNFEEASGATVVDASGKGNHGAISGATRTSSGKYGSALSFDGVNDWVTVNDSASLDLTTGMTLEAWVYPTATMSSWRNVLLKEQTGGLAYGLYANSDSNQPVASLHIGGDQNLPGGSALTVNTWVHLTATYDGATERLYVNGNQVASKAQAGSITVSGGALRIGGNSVWSEFFKGYIDEIRIYSRALSATEIQTDMNKAVATSSPPKRLLGDQVIGAVADSLVQGIAAAFQTTASVTGQVTSLPVYVDTASASTKLIAGIYKDNNGHPGALLAQGTLSSPVAGTWNKVLLPAIAVNAGTTYWVAILSPNGMLKFYDKVGSTARPSETSSTTTLTTLPSTWATGTISTGGPLSGYGAGY